MTDLIGDVPQWLPESLSLFLQKRKGKKLSLEMISTPPRTPKNGPDREINPQSGEGKLLALGWRLTPVPSYSELFQGHKPLLIWDGGGVTWLVIPPDEALPAQRFDNRRAALWWAQEQVGHRPRATGGAS